MDAFHPAIGSGCSRRALLRGAGSLALGLTLSQTGVWSGAAAPTETIKDILDITATVEAFGVTFLGEALASAQRAAYTPAIPPPVLAVLTAARAQENFHLAFFQSLGGAPRTDTFTVPPDALTAPSVLFQLLVTEEAAEISAQLAAFRTFAGLKRPDLAKVTFQYAAEEAEHRLLANYALGARPANDVAFELDQFTSVAAFYDSLKQRGIIGGSGTKIVYPGPGAIDASNVIETTPGGPLIACAKASGGTGQ